MPNHLTNENSPYLLQHVDNPVEWYPWGEEALARAKTEDKPILLSIGYAACHWCHVMAHESFENEATAQLMNTHFINIKVDREERPDLDSIYMNAVVAMTGQGGWPMTVFLTPDGRPFYGGTYYPPTPRYNMPSFPQLLTGVAKAWHEQRDDINKSADELTGHLDRIIGLGAQRGGQLDTGMLKIAHSELKKRFDSHKGGFGQAPKFPPSMTIEFLLRASWMLESEEERASALHMAEFTLKMMAYGGMYDQIGGGFARYSTDNDWLVPHFEKMLYDNALLSRAYLHAYQLTGNPLYKRIVIETLDFVVREMRHESGGFYSSYDADSEGVEGKFYVWSASEIQEILGNDADLFMLFYDITDGGNWEGHNIPRITREPEAVASLAKISVEELEKKLAEAKCKLYAVRSKRVWPGLDDKVLTGWNGLMLASFAEAGQLFGRADYTEIAIQNAQFLREMMRNENGRLLRTWKEGGTAKYNGYLEDYTYLADGLVALYQTTFDEQWFAWAEELTQMMLTHFLDQDYGGFYDTSDDHEQLLHRPKDVQDNATPSPNGMAVHVLLKMGLLKGHAGYLEIAEKALISLKEAMAQYPSGFAHWLCGVAFLLDEPKEIAIVGDVKQDETQALLQVVQSGFRPHQVTAVGSAQQTRIPLLHQRPQKGGLPTAYVCRQFVCNAPTTSPDILRQQLEG